MTRSEGRSSGSARRIRGLAAALALLVCASTAFPRPQEVEDMTGAIEKYRTILALANQKLEDLDLAEALARFSEVIDGYKAGRLPAGTPLTRQIVGQAYEGRARTQANLGANAEAEADYEALIRYDISWPIDRTRTSPKIVALYDKVRKRVVGTLSIKTDPPGASVTLNGEPIGRSPVFDRELPSGQYTVRIEAAGFDPLTETIALQGGARADKELKLTPNARSILVATAPVGARVLVDSEEKGVTFGVAGPDYAEWAARLGVAAAEISAPLLVEHLPPGEHMLKIEKECFEPQLLSITLSIDPNDNAPVRFEPIRLSPSLGSLSLETTPPGAQVILDGKPSGVTPLSLDGICSGPHRVTLRHDQLGQWIGTVEVARGQRTAVKERPRLTLAYVGMTSPGAGGQAPAGEEELGKVLARLSGYNVLIPGGGLPEDLLARKQQAAGDEPAGDYLTTVAGRTGADLIVAARPAEGGFERRCEVLVYPALPALRPLRDRVRVSLDAKEDAPGDLARLLEKLEEAPSVVAPYLGLRVVDLHRGANPVVIRVSPGGPAAAAGVKVGEGVVSLGGKSIATSRDLEGALASMKVGGQVSLTLQAPGEAPRQVNVVIGSTPVVLSPVEGGRLGSRAAVDLRFRAGLESALGRSSGAERTGALLSLGMLLTEAGLDEAALEEAFQKVEASGKAGLSAGTVAYLKGVALRRLSRLSEARQQFKEAAAQSDATMWRDDGPPVAERAARAIAALPPG